MLGRGQGIGAVRMTPLSPTTMTLSLWTRTEFKFVSLGCCSAMGELEPADQVRQL